MPKIMFFPGSTNIRSSFEILKKLIIYINKNSDLSQIRLNIDLISKEFQLRNTTRYIPKNQYTYKTPYLKEIESFNKSMEPYRSIFRMAEIDLIKVNTENGDITNLENEYYTKYVKSNSTQKDIEKIVIDYLTGVEWLYKYYVLGKQMEWSGWYYEWNQCPLIIDICKFYEKNSNSCSKIINDNLNQYPENNLTLEEHYDLITPNDFTQKNKSPNLTDVLHLIDGNGAPYLNKCQIKWHELEK